MAQIKTNLQYGVTGSLQTGSIAGDAIDGTKIADDAINSEHLAAGGIDTAHIADDQITLAKMAAGTDGNIITYDASGNPAVVATGTSGQLLQSAGAGSPPVMATVAGGDLTPSFYAYPNGNDTVSDNTATVVQNDVERYDTGGCYNATGSTVTLNGISTPAYSFAPNVSGKYFVYGHITIAGANNSISLAQLELRRIGATANGVAFYYKGESSGGFNYSPPMLTLGGIIDLNGSSEYTTMYINCNNANSQALEWWGGNVSYTGFGAFRIQGVS